MNVKRGLFLVCIAVAAACVLFATHRSVAQETNGQAFVQRNPRLIPESHHDVSPPLSSLPTTILRETEEHEKWNGMRPTPFKGTGREVDTQVDELGIIHGGPLVAAIKLNFDGISDTGFVPPDTNAAVGATQVFETVNDSYQIFLKTTGHSVLGPAGIQNLWSAFGGQCDPSVSGHFYSDPVVLYDKAAGRWFVSIVAVDNNLTSSTQCIAVSKTSDATGMYNRYDFLMGPTLGDYPKYGVWPDGYYQTTDTFTNLSFTGVQTCAEDRTNMLAGLAARPTQCFTKNGPNDFAYLPGDLDGSTAPPAGAPNPQLLLNDLVSMSFFKFHVDFTIPANSTYTGPTTITIPTWVQICPTTRACVPEPTPGERVDGIGDRVMYRYAYRNFGDHEAVVATHTVDRGSGIAGVRWYEFRNPNGTPTLFQSGTISESPKYIWMPSIGMDKVGDIAVGFSESSTTVHPSVQFAGRVPTDMLGKMEAIKTIVVGKGAQPNGNQNRWGDYSSMEIDPSDDCTFWYAQEYYKLGGNWSTRLTSIKFPTCH
jgi:hypothetical protein